MVDISRSTLYKSKKLGFGGCPLKQLPRCKMGAPKAKEKNISRKKSGSVIVPLNSYPGAKRAPETQKTSKTKLGFGGCPLKQLP